MMTDFSILNNYTVEQTEFIEEVNSEATVLRHKKSGARLALLENDDNNKVFYIGFRTPVEDSTGVPHIIEHTVLCGSEKYPVKDPFMELAKGSLNTFLNAMTYPDKTVYPVASCNDKDFKNLMSVYMDAVLNPNIYKEEKIFKQEGWHYELDSEDSELIYNGVVYNEMKGVHSSAAGIMDRVSLKSLFPDTGYRYESGGYPENIPELTYENYLDFHRRYYHPCNSYIYLYGNMDMIERLEWLDKEYLSKYEKIDLDSTVKKQEAFDKPAELVENYAITDTDEEKESAIFSENYVVGDNSDVKLNIAMQILDYAIMQRPGAEVKQALLDAGIGKDVYSQLEVDVIQNVYSIIAKFTDVSLKEKFKEIIDCTLKKIVKEGIDKKVLEGGINALEFSIKEADMGRYPKGLIFGTAALATWIYDDKNAFNQLKTNEVFKELREDMKTDYFEKLIEKYLLNNNHKSIVVLNPKKGLARKRDEELKEKMAKLKASLSHEELEEIIKQTKELKEYQSTPSTKEELMTIPMLELKDIDVEPEELKLIADRSEENGIKYIYTNLFTNKISYLNIAYECKLPIKYVPYVSVLKSLLSEMDTKNYSYSDLNSEINLNMGDFKISCGAYNDHGNVRLTMDVRAKAFDDKIDKIYEIAREVIKYTDFSDDSRLKVLLEEIRSNVRNRIERSGDMVARSRACSYYSLPHYYEDSMSGIGFYFFMKDLLDNFDDKKEELKEILNMLCKVVFTKDNMIVNYCGDKANLEKVKDLSGKLKDDMEEACPLEETENPLEKLEQKNEAFVTSGQVQFVARCGKFKDFEAKYPGSFQVLGNVMRLEYLWNNIRVLGGAYGCSFRSGKDGNISFTSYRDPNLKKTSDVYLNAADYVKEFKTDEREMRKYIIGTISLLDTPLNPKARSDRELSAYMTNLSYEELLERRKEVLSTTDEDIRALADDVKRAMEEGNICVVGSESAINKDKELFKEVKNI